MSRLVWNSRSAASASGNGKELRQTTLESGSPTEDGRGSRGRKRERVKEEGTPAEQPCALGAEDDTLWGPSGGGNRETQGRRVYRPFMDGAQRSTTFDASPYSREFAKAWVEVRRDTATKTEETALDPAILAPFHAPDCPRDLFAGKVFFLNSCDRIEGISLYLLEKLIRHLGGVTSLGRGAHVSYIVTQHMCSTKEAHIMESKKPSRSKCIHPDYILACARAGRILPESAARTIVRETSSHIKPLQPKSPAEENEHPARRKRDSPHGCADDANKSRPSRDVIVVEEDD